MEERYERTLDDAQKAIDRRNRARHDLEHALNDQRETPDEQACSSDATRRVPDPETWPRLPI